MSRTRHNLIVAILSGFGALAVAAPLYGQAAQTPKPGAPIRLETIRSGDSLSGGAVVRLRGRFAGVRSDTLFVTFDGDTAASSIPLALVTRTEMRSLRKRPFEFGAGIGALVGGSIGAIAAYTSYRPCKSMPPPDELCSTFNHPELLALLGGIGGALLGAGVGAVTVLVLVPREHWAEMPVDRLRLTVEPLPAGRLRLGASLAF